MSVGFRYGADGMRGFMKGILSNSNVQVVKNEEGKKTWKEEKKSKRKWRKKEKTLLL